MHWRQRRHLGGEVHTTRNVTHWKNIYHQFFISAFTSITSKYNKIANVAKIFLFLYSFFSKFYLYLNCKWITINFDIYIVKRWNVYKTTGWYVYSYIYIYTHEYAFLYINLLFQLLSYILSNENNLWRIIDICRF